MFQIKDFSSIVASMVNFMRGTTTEITDYNVGSVTRSVLEAPAVEIDELYQQMFIGLKEAIPVSVFNSFKFDAIAALPASGLVRFTLTSSPSEQLIQAGTRVQRPDNQVTYDSVVDVIVAPGNTIADVLVAAVVAGPSGNAAAGTITALVTPISGAVGVTNLGAFTNGREAETDDERRLRFNAYVQTLARGTIAAVLYGARLATLVDAAGNITEFARFARLIEPYLEDPEQPTGLVNLYIHNGVGGTSSELVARAQQIIDGYYETDGTPVPGYKAAGVVVVVDTATEVSVAVTGTVEVGANVNGAAAIAAAEAAIRAYLLGLDINQLAVKAELVAAIMEVPGVINTHLSAPVDDTVATASQKIVPGAVALTLDV